MEQKQEFKISQAVKEKVEAAKTYIERKYSKLKQSEKERKENWEMIEQTMEYLNLNKDQKESIKQNIQSQEAENLRKKRQKISSKDFEPLAIIGRGAFGEVRVCRCNNSKEILAIKKMKKSEMVFKNQVGHVRAEKEVLANANNPWIVSLKYSFQDEKYLYLVMEYVPGGDLMTLLMKKDILSEEEAKFYIAETIIAVDSVHKMDYIHRDLKPDNILLDAKGHIKLSDFGLCKETQIKYKIDFGKKMEEHSNVEIVLTNLPNIRKQQFKRNRQLAYSTVGTPDYIAPEVFGQQGYTETIDWWSVGVILYEMLVGYPPFFSEDPSITCQKILQWRKTLQIPQEANLSPAAVDIIKRLISDANDRLGINGVEEIKAHPFFAGIDWKRMRERKSPYIPDLKGEVDVSNFDKYDEEEPWIQEESQNKVKKNRKQDINFIGYTYKREFDNERACLVEALENLEKSKLLIQNQQMSKQQIENTSNINIKNNSYLLNKGISIRTESSVDRQNSKNKTNYTFEKEDKTDRLNYYPQEKMHQEKEQFKQENTDTATMNALKKQLNKITEKGQNNPQFNDLNRPIGNIYNQQLLQQIQQPLAPTSSQTSIYQQSTNKLPQQINQPQKTNNNNNVAATNTTTSQNTNINSNTYSIHGQQLQQLQNILNQNQTNQISKDNAANLNFQKDNQKQQQQFSNQDSNSNSENTANVLNMILKKQNQNKKNIHTTNDENQISQHITSKSPSNQNMKQESELKKNIFQFQQQQQQLKEQVSSPNNQQAGTFNTGAASNLQTKFQNVNQNQANNKGKAAVNSNNSNTGTTNILNNNLTFQQQLISNYISNMNQNTNGSAQQQNAQTQEKKQNTFFTDRTQKNGMLSHQQLTCDPLKKSKNNF